MSVGRGPAAAKLETILTDEQGKRRERVSVERGRNINYDIDVNVFYVDVICHCIY